MAEHIMEDLSIDCVIFGFTDELKVLLVKHGEGISKGKWALPGGWITYEESLDAAANRILYLLTGVNNLFLEQLKAFGSVDRFPTKRVVTVGYYTLIKDTDYDVVAGYTASDVQWFSLNEVPELPYDHDEILTYALDQLKSRVKQEPIGFNLLPEKFTLLQLQNLYESILQIKLDKPNFRRKILGMKLIVDLGEKQNNVSHRAAKLYKFDQEVYQALKEHKFVLDL
ncbi:NUDIX domain-containing protein [Marinoscillum sp. 108]|jgi:8-oxo-dGTP diphosphatase|uniref:NUDIX domain-containing protein n=1 Tax=Marinoscillum luteum TaxID=861051 RepID=A0ABW7N3E6_9BACT|nr:NUDIX domain-containing protein [Marinoscillum sp. 108]VXD21447.1 NUDIX hydrolase [Marinoscillum sp. 108]